MPKNVQKHIRLVHGRRIALGEILAAQINPELEFEPTKSVEIIKQKQIQSLQLERSKAPKKGERFFECYDCHKMFLSEKLSQRKPFLEKALIYHMPLHEDIQYACPFCKNGKYFKMRKYVRDHIIYKHGFDKTSKLPPLRVKKIKNYEYKKPIISKFECYLDHRTYPARSKLNSHMKSHLDILECNHCGKVKIII